MILLAVLKIFNDEIEVSENTRISNFLSKYNIEFGEFEINSLAENLNCQDSLEDSEREELISSYSHIENKFKSKLGYRADVVCFYPEFEYLDFILGKFAPIHFHYENEYWYFIDGEAKFGFLAKDGTKFQVVVRQGEYLQVPEGFWQWFELTDSKRMKAMRFFYTTKSIPKRVPVEF